VTPDDEKWAQKVSDRVPAAVFLFPKDERNPAPGCFCVLGPTSEYSVSKQSIGHAAKLYLAKFFYDPEAKASLAGK